MEFSSVSRRAVSLVRAAALAIPVVTINLSTPGALAPGVSLSTISDKAYAAGGINVVANARSAITTHGGYQYAAFYSHEGFATPGDSPQRARYVTVARREIGTTQWTVSRTGYSATAGNITDDHCSIAIGVDGNGYVHLNFGTHADPMRYIVSRLTVDAIPWGSGNITSDAFPAANFGGAPTAAFSYPEFHKVPGSKDLLLMFRDGGSGSGDTYVSRYNAVTKTYAPTQILNGGALPLPAQPDNTVSAYPNSFVRDSSGDLLMSWTWRETGGYQTNHDILFARSSDNGVTWKDVQGSSLAAAPFTVDYVQPVRSIPKNHSLINTTTMAVDSQDRPMIATWYAPGAGEGNHVRQYMLEYFDGTAWKSSQITQRTHEVIYGGDGAPTTTVPTNDNDVRELGRPLLLVDEADRAIVLLRYEDAGNSLVAAYSSDRLNWDFVTLDSTNLGGYEPASYDRELWESQNRLVLLYQKFGLGAEAGPIHALEWDARAYFASVPEPASVTVLLAAAAPALLTRRRWR